MTHSSFILQQIIRLYVTILNVWKRKYVLIRLGSLVLIVLGSNSGLAQIINIPDPNFKAVLLAASTNNTIAQIGTIFPDNSSTLINVKIDTNDNGEIEVNEVQDINYLNIVGTNVSDITGIENFINLKYFLCWQNNISSMDGVSGLTQIERIFCNNNQINSLNISNLINIRILGCWNNQINMLDFSNNPLLEIVYCGNNQLTSLDFSNNPLFKDLGCKNNPNLAEINIKNGVAQQFPPNTIYNECWTGCPSLSRICADSFELGALQAYLNDCGISTAGMVLTSTCALGTPTESLAQFAVYPNPSRGQCTIDFGAIKEAVTLDLYSVYGQKLKEISVFEVAAAELSLEAFPRGIYYLRVNYQGAVRNFKIIRD